MTSLHLKNAIYRARKEHIIFDRYVILTYHLFSMCRESKFKTIPFLHQTLLLTSINALQCVNEENVKHSKRSQLLGVFQ